MTSDAEEVHLEETIFRSLHNEDAMASDKLSERIHTLNADTRKLEQLG